MTGSTATSGDAYLSVSTFSFGSVDMHATVTRDAAVAEAWVRGLRASHPRGGGAPLIVGFDCKWNKAAPARHPWMAPRAAVLQLYAGAGAGCLVVQLLYLGRVPDALSAFLRDPRVRCVGFGVRDAAVRLAADHGLVCGAAVELEGLCAGYLGLVSQESLGLKEYAKAVLDLNMQRPKSLAMSDWEKRDLSVVQVKYACVDAYVSHMLGKKVLRSA